MLETAVRLLPTPTASRRSGLQSHGRNLVVGQLNPVWVEALMGFPDNWTKVNPEDFRLFQPIHGEEKTRSKKFNGGGATAHGNAALQEP